MLGCMVPAEVHAVRQQESLLKPPACCDCRQVAWCEPHPLMWRQLHPGAWQAQHQEPLRGEAPLGECLWGLLSMQEGRCCWQRRVRLLTRTCRGSCFLALARGEGPASKASEGLVLGAAELPPSSSSSSLSSAKAGRPAKELMEGSFFVTSVSLSAAGSRGVRLGPGVCS